MYKKSILQYMKSVHLQDVFRFVLNDYGKQVISQINRHKSCLYTFRF